VNSETPAKRKLAVYFAKLCFTVLVQMYLISILFRYLVSFQDDVCWTNLNNIPHTDETPTPLNMLLLVKQESSGSFKVYIRRLY